VKFTKRRRRRFDGHLKPATFANVIPIEAKPVKVKKTVEKKTAKIKE